MCQTENFNCDDKENNLHKKWSHELVKKQALQGGKDTSIRYPREQKRQGPFLKNKQLQKLAISTTCPTGAPHKVRATLLSQ